MSEINGVDYGPLSELVGVWKGDKGLDVAPKPEETEKNLYFETITYTPIGDLTNAQSQGLSILHYRQIVYRKSNNEVFHDETGYWMWDSAAKLIMHSLVIPRAVCVLAGGHYTGEKDAQGNVVIEVSAGIDDKSWQIIQSPFMMEKARTTKFSQKITVGNGKQSYFETTMLDIYGKEFEHTDENDLVRE